MLTIGAAGITLGILLISALARQRVEKAVDRNAAMERLRQILPPGSIIYGSLSRRYPVVRLRTDGPLDPAFMPAISQVTALRLRSGITGLEVNRADGPEIIQKVVAQLALQLHGSENALTAIEE